MSETKWRPMSEWQFPWEPHNVLVMVYERGDASSHDILRCASGGHGGLHSHGSMLTIIEDGWVAYAWRPDDLPVPDTATWPPMLTDWLTEDKP